MPKYIIVLRQWNVEMKYEYTCGLNVYFVIYTPGLKSMFEAVAQINMNIMYL